MSFEYELCFRCHADSQSKGDPRVNRQFVQTNTRFETRLSGSSYHPIVGPGKNPDVPSLISPYDKSSIINCTDCYNNNQGPNANGSGPNGPHGSIYAPILERQLVLTDGTSESVTVCALYPHGVANATYRINFNTDYVSPINGRLEFTDTGKFSGVCYLRCHGENHNPERYPD